MPEIPPPSPKPRYVCCCETEPPGLRCGPCSNGTLVLNRGANHNGCLYPARIN